MDLDTTDGDEGGSRWMSRAMCGACAEGRRCFDHVKCKECKDTGIVYTEDIIEEYEFGSNLVKLTWEIKDTKACLCCAYGKEWKGLL